MREHWTLDPGLRYVNHGSFGAVPAVTQRVQRRLQEAAEANPMRWFRELPARVLDTRERVGGYLQAPAADLALVTNATTGVNVALRSLTTNPGQRFVLTNHAYGAVALATRRIANERGCQVVVVDIAIDADDDAVVAAIASELDTDTACVLVDQITSATAKVLPVHRIVELGRRLGIPVIVDGAHAPGLLDEPVVGDYWTGNLHKWPCAPRGTGVLYVAPERQHSVVPGVISWGEPQGFPVSFDTPGTMDASGWLAAPTSLDLMASLGFADRRKELGDLVAAGAEVIADAVGGVVVEVGVPAPTMRLVSLPPGLVTDDPSAVRLSGVVGAQTSTEVSVTSWAGRGFLRLSAHLYNNIDDYVTAAPRLAEILRER